MSMGRIWDRSYSSHPVKMVAIDKISDSIKDLSSEVSKMGVILGLETATMAQDLVEEFYEHSTVSQDFNALVTVMAAFVKVRNPVSGDKDSFSQIISDSMDLLTQTRLQLAQKATKIEANLKTIK